jgi:hypothetical protein
MSRKWEIPMTQKADYKVIQENNAANLPVELNQLGMQGWKPVLLSTLHAAVGPAGQGTSLLL